MRKLRYRVLLMVAVMICLTALLAPTTSPQTTTCCTKCLQRFQQCDGTTIVCCQIYNSCIAQCPSQCPGCPDAK